MTDPYMLFDDEIRAKYKELGIKHLNEVKIGEEYPPAFLNSILRLKDEVHPIPHSKLKIAIEMDFITEDIKYVTATLYLLRPYINNPVLEEGKYHQTLGDRRYLMHTTFGLQAIYNFWDRIGDLLWYYFPTRLKEKDVYFERVINQVQTPYNASDPYIKLKELYETHVVAVLKERKETVHYFQPETRQYWGHIENHNDTLKVKKMFEEKYHYADMMKEQLAFAIQAFKLALELIKELPDRL